MHSLAIAVIGYENDTKLMVRLEAAVDLIVSGAEGSGIVIGLFSMPDPTLLTKLAAGVALVLVVDSTVTSGIKLVTGDQRATFTDQALESVKGEVGDHLNQKVLVVVDGLQF